MGNIFSNVWDKLFKSRKNVRMIMVGLDAAGKTTILYKMKLGETVKTLPTIGFNVEEIKYKKLNITLWDIQGQDRFRVKWKQCYKNPEGIIYVVDSSDTDRIETATEELYKMLEDEEYKNVPLLIFANKQDLPGAFSPSEIIEKMNLNYINNKKGLYKDVLLQKEED